MHDGASPINGSAAGGDQLPPPPRPLPEAVAQVAAGLLVAPEQAGPSGMPVIAGYELLAPLGRGGMGVVYQARHISTGQVVALKTMLGGAHARPGELARFRTEAAAVSRLTHPNIVCIHEVGEQGEWAYFAQEFVAGGSLSQQLAGQPQSAGPAAKLVRDVAGAMAYAHEHGVVHRDLKPANILLTADGIPKVSDFGLAKRLDPEPGETLSRGRTRTGEVLGTPSYMAPEQTYGLPGEVGPITDVYAMGAILYECLTGRPPFFGATPLDTLLQVRSEEPVLPRRLVPAVPRDLETICLKCLRKSPHRRYASAAALAEDLHRFLAGQPVLARPAGFWERTANWARRRKAAAALIGVSIVGAMILFALGAWHQMRLQSVNAELRTERDSADRLRDQAEAKEAEAHQQKTEAEAHFRAALAAVKQMLVRVSEEDDGLAHEPRMEKVRARLLQDALQYYQGFLKERPGDAEVRWETASTYLRLGDLRRRMGEQGPAENAYLAAIALFRGLADEIPDQPGYRHGLAGCFTNLGNLLANTPRQEEAERAYHKAREIQQSLVAEFPATPKYRSALAGSDHNLATLLVRTRRLPDAEQALRRALEHRQKLAAESPENAHYQQDVARTHYNLGGVLEMARRHLEAEAEFRKVLDLMTPLTEKFPRDPSYRRELAGGWNGLANSLDNTNRFDEAAAAYAKAVALQERLADEFPRVLDYRQELAHSHNNIGMMLHRREPREAEKAYRRSIELKLKLMDESPNVPIYLHELGRTTSSLAELLLQESRPDEARRFAEDSIRHQEAALKLLPKQPAFARFLARHYRVLAEAFVQLGDHAEAARAIEPSRATSPDELAERFRAGILARCIPFVEKDTALTAEQRQTLVRQYGDQAFAILREGLQRGAALKPEQLKSDPNLASLRSRPEFEQLLKEYKDAAKSGNAVKKP